MANRAYLRVWTRDFCEKTMIAEFARFLASAPLTAEAPQFTEMTVQPVDASESPLAAWDLRPLSYGPPEIAALAAQHLNEDSAYVVNARWDLWNLEAEGLKWVRKPELLTLACHGAAYDGGIAAEQGHFVANLGFEHLFTGHGGLLAPGAAANPFSSSEHPVEQHFRAWMTSGNHLKEYHAKTRENIQQLFSWVEGIERALPVEKSELWSEGEENFEARLDAILG